MRSRGLLFLSAAVLTWGSASGQISELGTKASVTAGGTYNVDLTTRANPEQQDEASGTGGVGAQVSASVLEGPIVSVAQARAEGRIIRAAGSLVVGPSAGLGSSAYARTAGELFEGFVFTALSRDIRGARAVVRLNGRARFANAPGVRGSASARVDGYFRENDEGGSVKTILHGKWWHDSNFHIPPVQIDKTGFIPLTGETPTPLQLVVGVPYMLKLRMEMNLSCNTGFDSKGNVVPAHASASVGMLVTVATGAQKRFAADPQDQSCLAGRLEQHGGQLVGLQLLGADGEVLDLAPGQVSFQSESGVQYPVIGTAFPWLGAADDFDQPARDEEQWSTSTGSGTLQQTNSVLEYSAPSGNHSAYWSLRRHRANPRENWELQTIAHLDPLPSQPGDFASVGIRILLADQEIAGLWLEQANANAQASRSIRATEALDGTPREISAPATGAEVALRIAYSTLTRRISFYFDPDAAGGGYAWTELHDAALPNTLDQLLRVEVGGRSSEHAVPSGVAWLDEFRAQSSASLVPHLHPPALHGDTLVFRACGEPKHRFRLEASEDFGGWIEIDSAVAADEAPLGFTVPTASHPRRFFRLRVQE